MSIQELLEIYVKINHCKGQLYTIDNIVLSFDELKTNTNLNDKLQNLRGHMNEQDKCIVDARQELLESYAKINHCKGQLII